MLRELTDSTGNLPATKGWRAANDARVRPIGGFSASDNSGLVASLGGQWRAGSSGAGPPSAFPGRLKGGSGGSLERGRQQLLPRDGSIGRGIGPF